MIKFTRVFAAAAAAAAVALTSLPAVSAQVDSLNAAGKTIKVEVPDNPKRIAVIDMAVLDMLDYWNLTDRIVAMAKTTPIPYMTEPFKDPKIVNVGTLKEVDLEKLMAAQANANHGNESSFELLVKTDPTFFFVLDRDSAIARPGAKLAKDILNNEMVDRMQAKKNDRIVYLTPAAWYLGEGGVTAMDIMMRDIEKPLGIEAPAVPKP